jgi:hypothetical protein
MLVAIVAMAVLAIAVRGAVAVDNYRGTGWTRLRRQADVQFKRRHGLIPDPVETVTDGPVLVRWEAIGATEVAVHARRRVERGVIAESWIGAAGPATDDCGDGGGGRLGPTQHGFRGR